jgi:hypothetical protein
MSNFDMYGDYGLREASAIRKRKVRSQALANSAMLGQQRGQRNMAEIQRRYSEGMQPLVASYGRRGIGGPNVQSGIRNSGLAKYAESLQRELGEESRILQENLNEIQATEASEQADLQDYLAELNFEKSKKIMTDAQNIKSLASY